MTVSGMASRPGGADSIGPTILYKNLVRNTVKWVLATAFVLYATRYAYGMFVILSRHDIWENDFFAIWSFAKFAIARSAGHIYDDATLHDFQMDLGSSPTYYLPYAYPPSFLLFIIPIGFLSYYAAFGVWIIGTFLFYLLVSTYKQASRAAVFLTMFAPATIITFAAGQTGFLSSAFILGGFRLVTSHPVLSGIMFGLASIKPQLGLLIPIALVSAGQWRTVVAAVATVLVLVFVSSLAFGWAIWPLWLSKLVAHANWAAEVNSRSSVTMIGNLTLLGMSLSVARIIQACIGVLVAIVIILCFRRGVTMLGTAAVLVGTFLATPYAFVYDMPMVTNAALAVVNGQHRASRLLTMPELVFVAMALVVPAVIADTWRLSMLRSLPLILLFGLIVWRILGRHPTSPVA